jgi:16S rRNA (guanine966-N2)-methyltransferase
MTCPDSPDACPSAEIVTRIVGGAAGGRRLRTPPGDRTRPTSDRVREALFSTVGSMVGPWDGLHVLDLYAGTGALGLEALSRGAGRAVFVESHRRTAALVQANARDLGLEGAEVAARTVQVHLARDRAGDEQPFDVVFADPPYDVPVAELRDVLTALVRGAWLLEGALLAVERSRRSGDLDWPTGLEPISRRPYGDTVLWYGRRCDTPGQPAQD